MSFLAKLFINGRAINVLDTNIQFYQQIDPDSFKPATLPRGGVFSLTIEADGTTDLLGLALSPDTMCEGYIRFYRRDGMSKLVDYEFFDTYIVNYQREFTAFNGEPAIDSFVLSPGILRIGDMVFEKWWKMTDLDREKVEATPVPLVLRPKLSSIKWKNNDGETIDETTYGQKVALEIAVTNPDGGSVEITIEKEDGTEFEKGQKTLSFTEYLTEEGTAQLNTLKIKNEWEEFRVADVDGLVAKVSHKGTGKTSSALQLVPPPKVIVDFRPNKGYDGEYGFDFIRDKKVKNDKLTYKDILGTNYEYDKTKKKWVEKFKKYPDDKKYDSLKDDQYKTVTFPWYKDGNGKEIEYIQSWLTIYPNDSQKLSLQIETVENPKKLDLTLDYDKSFFKLNTDKVPAQSKGKKHLDDHLIIECLKEFSTDQTIKVMYKKEQLGQLNILKNDKASRKKVEVVFVEVKTHLNIKKSTKEGKSTGKKPFLKKYLKQALIKPTIVVTPLDLTTDKNFNKKFAGKGKGYIDERTGLHDYLNKKMDKKYKDFLKVYFIGDKCPTFNKAGTEDGRINGQAKDINSDAVVLFQGHNTSTTAHEALHALGLYHTFSPSKSHPYSYKKGETYNIMDYSHQSKYGSKKRILTWLWQWKKLWNNPLIKLE